MAKLTEQVFFEGCDEAHRAFFGDLMARWRAAGQAVEMQASSAALQLGETSLVSLYPSYRNKGGAVRLNLEGLRRAKGEKWTKALAADLRAIEALGVGAGAKELIIQRPAESDLETHEAVKQVFLSRA